MSQPAGQGCRSDMRLLLALSFVVFGCDLQPVGAGQVSLQQSQSPFECTAPNGGEAFVVSGDGVACGMRRADGGGVGAVGGVRCGSETGSASAGCFCGKNAAGQLQFFCGGACEPNMQPQCITTNCGDISCVSGATCVARGHCESCPATSHPANDDACPATWVGGASKLCVGQQPCTQNGLMCWYPGAGDATSNGCPSDALLSCSGSHAAPDAGPLEWKCSQ